MRMSTLYSVVLKFSDGGENMNSFLIKDSAIEEANNTIELIKKSGKKGMKLYFSELKYDRYNNRLLSSNLINDESELLFEN